VLGANSLITIPGLAEKVGIAHRSVERHLKFLKDKGIIEREGAKKKGQWIVKKQPMKSDGYTFLCTS
jgi:predicted HTH transcriptional regulator